jgi:hypothetical protein
MDNKKKSDVVEESSEKSFLSEILVRRTVWGRIYANALTLGIGPITTRVTDTSFIRKKESRKQTEGTK